MVAGEVLEAQSNTNSTTLDVRQRCGSCNYGSCKSQTLQVGSCEPLCYACSNFCDDYYKVLVGSDGEYYFRHFSDAACTQESLAFQLTCDTCNVYDVRACSLYYINCGGDDWFLWFVVTITCLGLCLCVIGGVVAGVVFVIKKKKGNYSTI
eukprot:CAMPEP_0114612424 /NCGR_PEP_ID=MMETSP0168-20121206/4614_1 /TAXON_ID=95228 ORGANISM="Vannella sp., Strain DIVA3 517/6/12" /NCGR_SAMPLE_ID=MMETSP0168 /ASSEMBLY_ACC=CAM_ASM_000044 /LENGTH=150 /DNA_ID=CAMNT_0001823407 /DNA_START=77 /DNA_END=529 /DNA_ORIENTATION=+